MQSHNLNLRMSFEKSSGQATAETLVSMLALVPLFILIPYIGKYLDVKSKSVEANRYVAWERTNFSDPGAAWGADENSRDDSQIARDVAQRFFGDPRSGILTNAVQGVSENPLWRDHLGGSLIANAGPLSGGVTISEGDAPVPRGPAVNLLTSGFSLGPLDVGLDLNKNSFVRNGVSLPVIALPNFERRGAAIDIEPPTGPGFTFNQSGAILTDPWTPTSEENFVDRIDGLTVDEPLQFIVNPGTLTFGLFPFSEGFFKGSDPQLTSESKVVLTEYVDRIDL